MLTAGIDTQDDRLAIVIWGWGRGGRAQPFYAKLAHHLQFRLLHIHIELSSSLVLKSTKDQV